MGGAPTRTTVAAVIFSACLAAPALAQPSADGGADEQSGPTVDYVAPLDRTAGATAVDRSVPVVAPSDSVSHEGGIDVADVSLEDLLTQDVRNLKVLVASKREETVGDAPATLTVITAEDFARHGWQSVAEALRSVPGVYVSWGRDYFHTGVRGISFPGDVDSRVLVLIDGHTMNSPWNAASNTGELLSLPVAAIDRVEVVRGPASSVYGSNAFLAVVNIVSKKPTHKSPSRAYVELGASTAQSFHVDLAAHHRFGFGLELSGFGMLLTGDGPSVLFEDMTRPRLNLGAATPTAGLTRGTDYERGASAGLTLAFKGFKLTGQIRNRWKGLPTAPGDALFDDSFNAVADRHLFGELSWTHQVGLFTLNARAFADRFLSRRTLHLDPSDWEPSTWKWGDVRTVSEGNADRFGGELQGLFALHATDTLTVGVELTGSNITQPTYELDPATGAADPATVAGGIKDANGALKPIAPVNVGAYLQNDWRPLKQLGVVVGARYDFNTVFFRTDAPMAALAPRATVVFKPTEAATLKLSYGEAFRSPTAYEAFFDDQSSVCGNSNVRPERQRTVDLGGALNFSRAFNLSASAYWMQLEGLLVRSAVDPCYAGSGPRVQYVNAGNVTVVGGEASLDVRASAVSAFLNFGVNHVAQTVGTATSRPANSPTLVAGGGVALPILEDRIFGSLRAHFVSSRLNWTLDKGQLQPPSLRLEGALTGRRLWQGLGGGITFVTAFKLFEYEARYRELAARDPVSGPDTVPAAVPQNLVEVRAHLSYEL